MMSADRLHNGLLVGQRVKLAKAVQQNAEVLAEKGARAIVAGPAVGPNQRATVAQM